MNFCLSSGTVNDFCVSCCSNSWFYAFNTFIWNHRPTFSTFWLHRPIFKWFSTIFAVSRLVSGDFCSFFLFPASFEVVSSLFCLLCLFNYPQTHYEAIFPLLNLLSCDFCIFLPFPVLQSHPGKRSFREKPKTLNRSAVVFPHHLKLLISFSSNFFLLLVPFISI